MLAKIPDRRIVAEFIPHLESKFGFDARAELESWLADPGVTPDACQICLARDVLITLSPRDFRVVALHYVRAQKTRRGILNATSVRISVGGKEMPLGRFLTSAPDDAIVTFRNGNELDFRRENLIVTDKRRKVKAPGGSSQYLGVSATPQHKWVARIHVNGRNHHLGTFSKEVDAAKAYDKAARRFFGLSARLNFATDDERSALVALA